MLYYYTTILNKVSYIQSLLCQDLCQRRLTEYHNYYTWNRIKRSYANKPDGRDTETKKTYLEMEDTLSELKKSCWEPEVSPKTSPLNIQ